MISVPGIFTASEFYNAINYGADGLKIFPASSLNMMDLKQYQLYFHKT